MEGMDVDLLAVALRDSVARLSDQGLRDLLARLGEDSRADLLRLLQPRGEEHGAPRAASPVLDEEDDGMEEEEGKKFPCPACQRQFSRKWNCERHFQKAHGSRARFVCEQPGCKQSFGVAKDLERHVAAMHGGEHEQRSSHSSAHEADIKRTKTQVDEYLGIIAQRQSPG